MRNDKITEMTYELAQQIDEKARRNAVRPVSADDLLRIVDEFDCECYFLGLPDKIEYTITHSEEQGKIEVFDPGETDDYRHEEFATAKDALSSFIVDGKPLNEYWTQLSVVRVMRDC